MSVFDAFTSLARNINKIRGGETEQEEGIVSDLTEELTLKISDEELRKLAKQWEDKWQKSEFRAELERKQKENEKYYLGDHYTVAQKQTGKRELVDNLIFESLETALPFYTKQRGEPMVSSDETPEGTALSKKVRDRIIDLADTIRLRLKVKKSVRHWALYYLGCAKLGWSMQKNEIAVQVIRPQELILDPDAVTDECEYDGEYLGHYRTETATDLISRFPKFKKFITEQTERKLGTKIRYIEWWTNDYLFWTLKDKVLAKAKNPHWNYDQEVEAEPTIDDFGNTIPGGMQMIPGVNHFSTRKIPFAFLSVFSLGKNPADDTTLIEQVLPLQDVVNKRQRQIDKNADSMNAGAVVSGDAFTKDQAKNVSEALRKGTTVWVPRGNVNNVYKRDAGVPLPQFVFNSLTDYRNEIRGIFGTTGLSSQGIKSEETVRGKILVRATDADRNPLIDHLEQFYDYIYNWFTQLMVVHYDAPHNVNRAQGATTILNSEFVKPLVVSVKEGSLIPKDSLTKRNEAVDLAQANLIDPLTFFERLEDPNPEESAKRLVLWTTNKIAYAQLYTPEIAQFVQPPIVDKNGKVISGENVEKPSTLLSNVPI